ncbi:polyisoprenoid-binding protein [Bacteriovorax stolpii]|uniref:Polyisoprenoid-binding protein n=1 Tax=Bacteriovorax stolpii TaxID=960 RepID=A0A2K9NQK2_BACTC|nr:YceI family protein [Bacteriovorax stolpii]AUN97783.1 polyisoprenoid-binding protein [Bacteriovorax stolpii]QDK42231.1 polyisoprenoid-binding protein [Bacteriovorax stolpii]TDP51604.1 polyisoprenoid-binding protein YceI [Bacteriovorax stolpii]
MYRINKTSTAFKIFAVLLAVIILFFSHRAFAIEYRVDQEHSRVGFTIKHMMLTNIHGQFNNFEGSFDFDPTQNLMTNANFIVRTASLYTAVDKRDDHLKSADFFDVTKYPTMTLENIVITRVGKTTDPYKYKLTGDLTLHGKTKREVFDLVYTGTKKAKNGETRAGFAMTGKINRMDYGMNWGPKVEGDVMINKDVFIEIDVSAIESDTRVPGGNQKLYEAK